MSEEYSNGYARGYEAGQQSVLKLAEQPAQQQETINGRTVKVDWKAQALELRELVRLGGIKIAELEAELAEQPAQPQQEQQIAEALRSHGLTLIKTERGYDVMNLRQITAHGIKEQP